MRDGSAKAPALAGVYTASKAVWDRIAPVVRTFRLLEFEQMSVALVGMPGRAVWAELA